MDRDKTGIPDGDPEDPRIPEDDDLPAIEDDEDPAAEEDEDLADEDVHDAFQQSGVRLPPD
jgi:hypothetical protein